ncbi:hypothetical protein COCON_G00150670 [Conger conger]|uniref:Transcription cofactor vestigial-like protein 4 n=1 Tax=Conger conger TaxID=82655 RepID=A0A9Q1HWT8_CONCO|nr:hypothetical protein COCON_G00150670 [Conger conger]
MAVTNFHYITRMSSGFKVYILEGQPNMRTEDRRQMWEAQTAASGIDSYPLQEAESSPEPGLQHPTSHVLHSTNGPAISTYQKTKERPRWTRCKSPKHCLQPNTGQTLCHHPHFVHGPSQLPCTHPAPMVSPAAYDHVVEEHFRRSLGVNYHKASSCQLSVSVSVDDHFAKALGEKWFQLKASTSPCSSSPSPTATVPGFRLSSQSPDDITTIPGRPFTSWSDKGQANTKK